MDEVRDEAGLAARKKALRAQMMAARERAHGEYGGKAGEALAALAAAALGEARGRTVSGFHSYGSEIDCLPLLAAMADAGWGTCLPVVVRPREPLVFRRWRPGEPTEPGRWDIPVPRADAETVDPDILLVPLLAFDRSGYRLGYGGGFYDRTLDRLRRLKPVLAVGIAYSAQEVEAVPRGDNDEPVDLVLTEKGPVRLARQEAPPAGS
ncbi:5-formyltetrahydrofolate cyclo-ligase [Kaustia mangrovi]|uniref:5-formyltetrahydrofolate cyclo-ligase n=1 Tax=Kaustia mangrovi TaxID=2593653 RepID=A0A7S8HCT7_9HYPH|nr:5-formyltetrahydrofolate cyclo-ligase [Kaustia mangrovi]QPC43935.1 5-formyltetrahydrofolate cyclo-ligase [Kaustia mangrovi]